MKSLALPAVALVIGLWSSAAAAQHAADAAIAQALYEEARELAERGDHAQACPKLEESQRLDPGAGTAFWLADCYEQTGHFASAWTLFLEVAVVSKKEGQLTREAIARERAEAVKPKLQYLVIVYEGEIPEGLALAHDGRSVGIPQLGVELPIDAGDHELRAEAPGFATWDANVRVPLGQKITTVGIPALRKPAPPAEAPAAGSPIDSEAQASAAESTSLTPDRSGAVEAADSRETRPLKSLGVAAGGVGFGALVAGVVVGLVAKSKATRADCDANNLCSPGGVEDRKDALKMAGIATGLTIAGGALAATGIGLVLFGPTKSPTELAVSPRGLTIEGRW